MDEMFEVVDEQDRVIEMVPRSKVHARGLRHRAVHVLVFNAAGRLFLQKRSMQKDCFPGAWDSSAAGHLEPGESYDACALREVEEELGVRLEKAPERLFKIDACPETGQEFVWVYRSFHEGPFVLQPEEIETGGWFGVEEVDVWLSKRPEEFAGAVPLIWGRLKEIGLI